MADVQAPTAAAGRQPVSAIITSGHWFGPPERPLAGWLSVPAAGATDSGVLLLPPVGYQYWSAHRTLRVLAEQLAGDGHVALRIDYDGTGDSAGDQWEPGRVRAWRASARLAAGELRKLGCRRLTVVGVRVGGLIGLVDGAELGADAVVAWSPVLAGRRYVKEIKLLSTEVPPGHDAFAGALLSAGTVFREETLGELAELSLASVQAAPAATVTLIDDAPSERSAAQLRELGCEVAAIPVAGGESALEAPAEYATVPETVVEAVVRAVGPPSGEASAQPEPTRSASFAWSGRRLTEEIVEIGPERLVGVMTRPPGYAKSTPIAVFLSSGSEPHIGPGRAWVEYARGLAAAGYASVRVDFSGWGESPDGGRAPGRPYDAHCETETVMIVRELRRRGFERVVLVGLCAGAWIALRAVLSERVDGVVALNPQLYWEPGDPVEATMAETHLRRTEERRREHRGARCGWWTALDLAGARPWAGGWLDRIDSSRTRVLMLFAEGDDGLEYLRVRLGRRLARVVRHGRLRVVELPEIDHSMHRAWLRASVLSALVDELGEIAGEQAATEGASA